jgi:integrase
MAITNLEHDWRTIRCPPGKGEETFWHIAGASRREHFSALGLKVRATGSRVWVWDYRDGAGVKRRRSYGSPDDGVSFDAAQRAILIDRVAIGEGVDPAAREREAVTSRSQNMSNLIDAYIVELDYGVIRSGETRRPEFTRKVKARLEIIRARWGSRPAETIKRSDISALLDEFNPRPPTQRVMQATINAFFAFLADRYELPHPGRGMQQRGGSRECVRYLDDAELRLAIPAMRSLGYPRGSVMLMALYTGRRVNEITGMEWSEIDLASGLHHLPAARSKNHRSHALPLSAGSLAILKDAAGRKVGPGRYVFHSAQRRHRDAPIVDPDPGAMNRIAAACAPATVARLDPEQREPFTMHDLRRTAATHLEALGCPLETIKAILNHASAAGITRLYARSDPLPRMREWLDKLSEHYANLQ